MDPSTPATGSSSNCDPSLMMLPDPAVGIIDLATLKEIHRFLNHSMLQDDRELAAWVQQHFLYEPIISVGREVRTTESFSQLDRAYRRARSLTNKAQDKWPFFNRDWKEMSSATVRNNARGEAAPGVALPGMSGAMHDSPMSNGQTDHTYKDCPTPTPFVPFGTSKPTRHDPHHARQQQSFATTIPNTPVPLPPTKQEQRELRSKADLPSALREDPTVEAQIQPKATSTDLLSERPDSGLIEAQTSVESGSTAEIEAEAVKAHPEQPIDISSNAPAMLDMAQSLDPTQQPTDDAAHDPDGGKVRGSNGRFMPKENSGRPKRVSKAKLARKSRVAQRESVVADSTKSTTPAPIHLDHETMAEVLLTPESVGHSKSQDQNGTVPQPVTEDNDVHVVQDVLPALATVNDIDTSIDGSVSEPKSNVLQNDTSSQSLLENSVTETPSVLCSSPSSLASTIAYTLAAESDPVPSNLDRLPPGSRLKKKRKSEATAQETPRRKRGRPLKSEQPTLQVGKVSDQNAADQPSTATGAGAAVTEEFPKMVTRRMIRESAAATLEKTAPVKSAPKQPSPERQTEHDEDKTMVDIDDDEAIAGHKASTPVTEPVRVPSPRLTRAKAATSDVKPSKLNLFALDDKPIVAEIADPFALGLLKTGSSLKRSDIKKTSKTPSKEATKSTPKTPSELAPASTPQLTHGTTCATSIDGVTPIQGGSKVEFFARVQTSTGKVEVPMTADDLQDDVEMIKKYAEWMEKEEMQITYHAFKSIFGLAKKV